ncbi:hypothetical protein BKA66DRAFT_454396 [Pyrenochaeta sp. MPI-SDFR-AT-0127]|nr:hypothetical protein BKA66DRAFT_454396 [Pyrenochaeta sp. MPI-SDFR-AT-0127]
MELSSLPSLQNPLQDEIHPKIEKEIIGKLWPDEVCSKQERDWKPFLSYYTQQCKHALHDRGKHVLVRTHQQILDITSQFRQLVPREEINSNLRQLFTSKSDREQEILNNSIDLAARLYLMISIGDSKYAVSSGTSLIWEKGNLKDFLSTYFNEPYVLSGSNIKFEKTFNAYTLERIAGIKVKWTNNLIDHLRIIEADEKTVEIFPHASFLKHATNQLFPAGLLNETQRTLALLFPPHDQNTETFLQKLDGNNVVDKHLTYCTPLRLSERQIETYSFWHDRLILLKQAFDQSRPATLSQWWYDRRNGVQWYTFWVAIVVLFLTTFFGMVQSIEGAMQVYKAYHPT